MSAIIRADVPTGFDDLTWSDSGRPNCQWSEGVCTESPTHYLTWRGPSEEGTVAVHCVRHHVLTLAELLELHLRECGASLDEHLAAWGEI